MVIYIVYQKFYADFENGEDDALLQNVDIRIREKQLKKQKN